jgi:hypothetical protein
MNRRLNGTGFVLMVILIFGTEQPALAYTDPGSGALIWQLLVAAFAGALFYFRRFAFWLKKRRGPKDE